MTTRVEQFAARFEAVNDEIIATITGCTDEQWRQPSASEGWPVGVVAHHVAVSHAAFNGLITALVAGETLPSISMEVIDRGNAQHARDYSTVGKPEAIDALRTNGIALAQTLRRLSDEQLDQTAGSVGGQELSVAEAIERIVIDHPGEHLASIRATIGE